MMWYHTVRKTYPQRLRHSLPNSIALKKKKKKGADYKYEQKTYLLSEYVEPEPRLPI